jgi:ABC-type lipoprotein release transport system permease subunit
MKLIRFSYLERKSILILASTVLLSSILFMYTSTTLLGFYSSFNAYLGEGKNIVVLYDKNSRTPFTGLISLYLLNKIKNKPGVLAYSPEVVVPCVMNDKPILVRGIIFEDFLKVNPITIVNGSMLKVNDINSMIVGKNVAEKFNLKPNDKVLIFGVLANRYVELQVKGIYESQSSMDNEVIVQLYMAQLLRGIDYSQVTLIRVKIDRNITNPTSIFKDIANESSKTTQLENENNYEQTFLPLTSTNFDIKNVAVSEAQNFIKNYLDRYGVTKEALLILSIMIFFLSSANIVLASEVLIIQNEKEIGILRSLGMSQRNLKVDLLVKLLLYSIVSSAVGILVATIILTFAQEYEYLQVLSYTFQFDPLVVAVNIILVFVLILATVVCAKLKLFAG